MHEEKDKEVLDQAIAKYLSAPKSIEKIMHKILIDECKRKTKS